MKALVLVLTLVTGFAVYAADKKLPAKAELPTKVEPKPAVDDGSKPLALPDNTLVDRYKGSSERKFTQICTTSEGRTYKQDEKGYSDCLGKVNGQAMEINGKDPNSARNPVQKKDSAGFSYSFGK